MSCRLKAELRTKTKPNMAAARECWALICNPFGIRRATGVPLLHFFTRSSGSSTLEILHARIGGAVVFVRSSGRCGSGAVVSALGWEGGGGGLCAAGEFAGDEGSRGGEWGDDGVCVDSGGEICHGVSGAGGTGRDGRWGAGVGGWRRGAGVCVAADDGGEFGAETEA